MNADTRQNFYDHGQTAGESYSGPSGLCLIFAVFVNLFLLYLTFSHFLKYNIDIISFDLKIPSQFSRTGAATLMDIDETNIEILRHLKDGRKSFKLIAEELSVTENTIRSRVNRMIEEGILKFSGTVQVDALNGHNLLYLGVKLKNMDLQNKAEQFSKLRGVVSAGIVTGRYDIILQVLLGQDYSLLEFITEQVARVEDVQTVESFIVYKGYNLKVPYIL